MKEERIVSSPVFFLDVKVSSLLYLKQICSLADTNHLSLCHLSPAHAVLI